MPATGDNLRINSERLWDSLMQMGQVGPGIAGGNNRQTLTDADNPNPQPTRSLPSRLSIGVSTPFQKQYPQITPPVVSVTAFYPGATPEAISQTVAAPLEQQINGVEHMVYMQSGSASNGQMNLNVYFEIGTDPSAVWIRRSSRAAMVRWSGGRRSTMSTASSAPAGR